MTPSETYAWFERVLARVMTSPDPVQALAAAQTDPELPRELRTALGCVEPEALRRLARQVTRHRLRRLLDGDPKARRRLADDPAGFLRDFVGYHRSVPPRAFFPRQEARLYDDWLSRRPAPSARSRAPRLDE